MAAPPPKAIVKALGVIPRISSLLSLLGSGFIILHIMQHKKRRSEPHYRLLAGLSLSDLIASLCCFLGPWAAAGSQEVCTLTGFFSVMIGPLTPMYNAVLQLNVLWTIRNKRTRSQFSTVEKWIHPAFWTLGLAMAVSAVPQDLINPVDDWVCWIGEYPSGCLDSARHGEDGNCERGDNAWIYQWAFFLVPVWLSFFVTIVSMLLVYMVVLDQEKKLDAYSFSSSFSSLGASARDKSRQKSRAVARQGVYFSLAFLSVWVFATINRILYVAKGSESTGVTVLATIFVPLQGFWNFLIYNRYKIMKWITRHLPCFLKTSTWRRKRPNDDLEAPSDGRPEKEDDDLSSDDPIDTSCDDAPIEVISDEDELSKHMSLEYYDPTSAPTLEPSETSLQTCVHSSEQ